MSSSPGFLSTALRMSLEFPFEYERISLTETLFYPMVTLQIKTISGWRRMRFLVDTGADFTTLPDHILPIVGVNRSALPKTHTVGVGGVTVPVWSFSLPVRIGSEELVIPALAVATKGRFSPALLGKKGVFESLFSLTLDSKNQVTRIWRN